MISFKDIETQHSNDVKPIADPIKDNQESFLSGLFQFRRAREQFRGWDSATYLSKHQAANSDVDSDDDTDMHDANKWKTTKIDLFKDFEKIDIEELKAWAETVWSAPNAMVASQDGQSETYARKVFSEFIFASLVPELQKAIQNSIPVARHWNDGPYVWATLVHRFFPSAVVLRTTILSKMKSVTLAEHKNDLSAYCATLLDMNAVVDTTSHDEELVTAFLSQTNTHPSDIVRNHFHKTGVKFFMNKGKRKSFASLLETADRLHTVTTSPALPFASSSATSSKQERDIIALAGLLKDQTGSMKKIVAALSQLDNKVKQGNQGKNSNGSSGGKTRRDNETTRPPWKYIAPSDPSEVKEFGGKSFYYCAKCGRWSTTHSTDGLTHNGVSISKHDGSSSNKKRNVQMKSQSNNTKKSKGPSTSVNGLQSLKAELQQQNSSSVFDLIRTAAGGQ
jgi:hypothetical protein